MPNHNKNGFCQVPSAEDAQISPESMTVSQRDAFSSTLLVGRCRPGKLGSSAIAWEVGPGAGGTRNGVSPRSITGVSAYTLLPTGLGLSKPSALSAEKAGNDCIESRVCVSGAPAPCVSGVPRDLRRRHSVLICVRRSWLRLSAPNEESRLSPDDGLKLRGGLDAEDSVILQDAMDSMSAPLILEALEPSTSATARSACLVRLFLLLLYSGVDVLLPMLKAPGLTAGWPMPRDAGAP